MKVAIEKLCAEIEREHEQMKRDREEFERSKARTRDVSRVESGVKRHKGKA